MPTEPDVVLWNRSSPVKGKPGFTPVRRYQIGLPAQRRLDMSDRLKTERSNGLLFVDLDGSLVTTDLLWESVFQLIKRRPGSILMLSVWAFKGRAQLKARVAERIAPETAELPYNQELIDIVRAKRAEGVRVVLATASAREWAEAVASHLGYFDDVLATSGDRNLKGWSKLEAIRSYCEQHGYGRYAYVGDSKSDLPIWREAEAVYVVNPTESLSRRVRALDRPIVQIGEPQHRLVKMVKALRPQQWVKNILVFLPLLTSMRIFDVSMFALALAAFIPFCCCSSAIYIINDLGDLAADRAHTQKRRRAFASGGLPLAWGPPMSAVLLALSLLIAWFTLPGTFLAVLLTYVVATLAYSFVVKTRLMADALLLAVLYCLRIIAGNFATGIPISEWLLAFSLFFFLSLALVKRFVELDRSGLSNPDAKLKGRGYRPPDVELVETFGACSGYLSVLVLALYIKSAEVRLVYNHPELLWGVCLILIYWISRIWFLARRGEMSDDPVVFALTDRHSRVLVFLVALIIFVGALAPAWKLGPTS